MSTTAKIRRELSRVCRQVRGLFSPQKKEIQIVQAPFPPELELQLDYVVRELVRLQMQVEQLHQALWEDMESRAMIRNADYRMSRRA